jgi:hypothetical protein
MVQKSASYWGTRLPLSQNGTSAPRRRWCASAGAHRIEDRIGAVPVSDRNRDRDRGRDRNRDRGRCRFGVGTATPFPCALDPTADRNRRPWPEPPTRGRGGRGGRGDTGPARPGRTRGRRPRPRPRRPGRTRGRRPPTRRVGRPRPPTATSTSTRPGLVESQPSTSTRPGVGLDSVTIMTFGAARAASRT